MAKQNNNLLMKNRENHPKGSKQLPKVNEAYTHNRHRKDRGPFRERGHDHDQERNFFGVSHSSNKNQHQKEKRKDEKREATRACYFRYGGKEVITRDCRTSKHLVELYQELPMKKEKYPKANFISENQIDVIHLDIAVFFCTS